MYPYSGRPPAEVDFLPHCCGKYEEAPKKTDDTSNRMLLLMHKANKQTASMIWEEKKLREVSQGSKQILMGSSEEL
ncbi:hypothetical protein VP01_6293g1 [Puccinia sorghi]|uniref:Uncharacterized protein n=1 Tax=Puccinia sorghi TaxID=27349 RepID=A0A0L6UGB4_9BASI|nr:hypothetical protein VP01_6293g1 [Puccinia sorghi]